MRSFALFFFFFNDTATTEIYTLSLHDALPIHPGLKQPAHVALLAAPHRGPGSARPVGVVVAEDVQRPVHRQPHELLIHASFVRFPASPVLYPAHGGGATEVHVPEEGTVGLWERERVPRPAPARPRAQALAAGCHVAVMPPLDSG